MSAHMSLYRTGVMWPFQSPRPHEDSRDVFAEEMRQICFFLRICVTALSPIQCSPHGFLRPTAIFIFTYQLQEIGNLSTNSKLI